MILFIFILAIILLFLLLINIYWFIVKKIEGKIWQDKENNNKGDK